ncbi:MAG TPA: hypothetical protein VKA21_16160, partial [Candidatus Binatia bacterium]|nr:hypothetical protein [Candidatus Binatia bacterium]
ARAQPRPSDVAVPAGASLAERRPPHRIPGAATVLWLGRDDLAALDPAPYTNARVYLSSSLLDGDLAAVPPALRTRTAVVHPFSLPKDLAAGLGRVESWMRSQNLEQGDERIAAQTYFACSIAVEGLMHVGAYVRREYFLDAIDHLPDVIASAPFYPRLSFGTGRPYLANGCYVIELGAGGDDVRIEAASWVAPG